jgi:protein-arginine kinase
LDACCNNCGTGVRSSVLSKEPIDRSLTACG